MYHYKARAYSPTLGRFMQTDPIGYGDGMNMYAYVGNNPVNSVDPTGLSAGCVPRPGSRIKNCSARLAVRAALRDNGFSGGGSQIDATFEYLGGGSLSDLTSALGVEGGLSADSSSSSVFDQANGVTLGEISNLGGSGNEIIVTASLSPAGEEQNPGNRELPLPLTISKRAESNGCGNDTINVGPVFEACHFHDICWTTFGAVRSVCDAIFLLKMRAECSQGDNLCLAAANAFYRIVSGSRGDSSWNSAQAEASIRKFYTGRNN